MKNPSFKQMVEDIVGVQPMSASASQIFNIRHITTPKYYIVDPTIDKLPKPPRGYITIEANMEISRWIESQPLYMWRQGDVPAYIPLYDRFMISEELFTLLALKWVP